MQKSQEFRFSIPATDYDLLDKSIQYTADDLFLKYPHTIIVVLDFALRSDNKVESQLLFDGSKRFIATQYQLGERTLLNIDHHNELAASTPYFSTTHQIISAIENHQFNPQQADQIVLVNHDDADSILALLVATHSGIPNAFINKFSEAAKAADHTGESNPLVDLVDIFYRKFDLENLIPLINALLHEEILKFPDQESEKAFNALTQQPHIIEEYLQNICIDQPSLHGTGSYDPQSKILALQPNDSSINTIRVLPIAEKMKMPISILMTSRLLNSETNQWKISLRSGPDFPAELTLAKLAKKLHLEVYGYGGRKNAGGIGRYPGEKTITPNQLFSLLRTELVR